MEFNNYLLEKSLGKYLKEIFKVEWIHNRKFLNYNFRPDYRNDNLKCAIEFNGYLHYTLAKTIIDDERKELIIRNSNYNLIIIPYWIQLTSNVNQFLFKNSNDYSNGYPNGFISKNCVLPANFCSLGIYRFRKELESFPTKIQNEVIYSIKEKIKELNDIRLVIPKELEYMVC